VGFNVFNGTRPPIVGYQKLDGFADAWVAMIFMKHGEQSRAKRYRNDCFVKTSMSNGYDVVTDDGLLYKRHGLGELS